MGEELQLDEGHEKGVEQTQKKWQKKDVVIFLLKEFFMLSPSIVYGTGLIVMDYSYTFNPYLLEALWPLVILPTILLALMYLLISFLPKRETYIAFLVLLIVLGITGLGASCVIAFADIWSEWTTVSLVIFFSFAVLLYCFVFAYFLVETIKKRRSCLKRYRYEKN